MISVPLKAKCDPRALAIADRSAVHRGEARGGWSVICSQQVTHRVEEVLDDLRSAVRQGLVEAKKILVRDLLAAFDRDGDELAELSGRLFHSDAAQAAFAAWARRS